MHLRFLRSQNFQNAMDVIGLSLMTIGDRASRVTQKLFEAEEYTKYLYLHGLSVETAEALAEYLHKMIRQELGIAGDGSPHILDLFHQKYRGSRYSFGYPACPNLEDQTKLFALLHPEENVGVRLTTGFLAGTGTKAPPPLSCTNPGRSILWPKNISSIRPNYGDHSRGNPEIIGRCRRVAHGQPRRDPTHQKLEAFGGLNMRPAYRYFASAVLSLAVISGTVGCASHSRVRVYDPYRSDYHHWDRRETVYYNQWVVEGHRDNRDYNHLRKDEQRNYWEWRHQHDRGRDHDQDRDHDHR